MVLTKRSPVQALLQVERPIGRDVGKGQGGDQKGKQKQRVGDLADDRCSSAVLDLRSTHLGRTAPPVRKTGTVRDWRPMRIQGKQGRMERRTRRRMEWRSKRSSAPRTPGIGFPWCGIGFFPLYFLGASSVRYIFSVSGGARELSPSPLLGASAPGWDGRQN